MFAPSGASTHRKRCPNAKGHGCGLPGTCSPGGAVAGHTGRWEVLSIRPAGAFGQSPLGVAALSRSGAKTRRWQVTADMDARLLMLLQLGGFGTGRCESPRPAAQIGGTEPRAFLRGFLFCGVQRRAPRHSRSSSRYRAFGRSGAHHVAAVLEPAASDSHLSGLTPRPTNAPGSRASRSAWPASISPGCNISCPLLGRSEAQSRLTRRRRGAAGELASSTHSVNF